MIAAKAGGQNARKPQTQSVSVDAPNLASANGWIGFGYQYCMDRRLGLGSSEGYRVDRLIRRSPPVSMSEFRKNRREAVFLFAQIIANVRYWPKTDIGECIVIVRFWG